MSKRPMGNKTEENQAKRNGRTRGTKPFSRLLVERSKKERRKGVQGRSSKGKHRTKTKEDEDENGRIGERIRLMERTQQSTYNE